MILAQKLWDNVAIDWQALDVTQEQINELDQRLAPFEMVGEVGSSRFDVKERVLKN